MSGRRAHRALAVALLTAAVAVGSIALAAGATKKSSANVAFHATATVSLQCAKGQAPVFAGFETTLAENGPFVHADAVKVVGRSARVSAVNEQGGFAGGPGMVTGIAYCGSRAYLGKASAFVTLPAQKRGSVVAKCPAGFSVALGGFHGEIATNGQGAGVYVDGLERVSERKWRVSGINTGIKPGKLESFAYCTAGSQHLSSVEKSVQVPTRKTGAVTATCPKGTSLAVGGVRSQHYGSGYGELQLRSMKRKGARGWQVSALKFEALVGKLTAIAYCG